VVDFWANYPIGPSMEKDQLSRKLAVILHADVVGSTSHVLQNESLAHQRIQDTFTRFSGTIQSYGGETHEQRGDALVAVFHRASDAVAAALAFQIANEDFNTTLTDDMQPRLRVGISLGEVVIADNTITGAGVVLAQRLEQLSESGGVCIQGAAYETVPQRFPFEYKNLGEQKLKGFEAPVLAYAITLKFQYQNRLKRPLPLCSISCPVLPHRTIILPYLSCHLSITLMTVGRITWLKGSRITS